ncbi:type I-A CRISPR-associated protein Cas7/Csa2 [Desulfurococcus amylolyticus]|uniref:CRISPR-associated autoregulator, Csa2 family n=1 Tax=Desulfurococcus amylolyticus DSM 16532 TaxID=768672 RepID=I3XSH6_DESAM|nr:type I-A CRISPR-associated protein Cas7/Csa2 [Desulfurococcus amylolyticus]AFL66900.1 CRISPR-associated autoregulator, Csa2 family [Desulfurococcus amylolyticus DSM 16532]
MQITIGLSLRVLVNAEALNMAEAVGNYTRHRKAPVVVSTGAGYSVVYVPAVSGESIAHHYQLILAQIAKSRNLPVTSADLEGYFIKFTDKDCIKTLYPELKELNNNLDRLNPDELESAFLKASVVADVGGFLYLDKAKIIKRTSAIRFSYMLPTLDAIEQGGVALIPQLHTRYAPPELMKDYQKPFYVESGSALYTLTAELIATDIARQYYSKQIDGELSKQKIERVKAAIDALIALTDGLMLGAKRSRYNPLWKVKSAVVTLSKGPVEFIPSSGISRTYIAETYSRALQLTSIIEDETINIFAYNDENLEEPEIKHEHKRATYEKAATHTEALAKARDKAVKVLEALPK